MSAPVFAAHDLSCLRGERLVFAHLNFAVVPGEALVLTGPNGSGKSSLLRLAAGLSHPEAGQLAWNGEPIEDDADAHRARLTYVGHQDAVKPSLSVGENLRFWTEFLGAGGGATKPALDAVDLAPLAGLPAAYLSAGQRRRLSIARLIAVPRPLWLLDEPTSALDAPSQQRLAELMRGHLANGGMIVAAAHGPIGLERARELKLGPP